jgi:hypothetical protein
VAVNYFTSNQSTANLSANGASVATPSFTLNGVRAYVGSVSATVPTTFLGVMGIRSINVNVSGTASVRNKGGAYYCVMALNPAAQAALTQAGLRVEVDGRQEKIGYKIREAQLQKVPYMLVLGDREAAEGTVAVRTRTGGDLGSRSVADFLAMAQDAVATKSGSS